MVTDQTPLDCTTRTNQLNIRTDRTRPDHRTSPERPNQSESTTITHMDSYLIYIYFKIFY